MLDQSFSAHNFETIYCLESRKGNIDIQTMPEEYRDVLARSEELKKAVSVLRQKKDRTQEEALELDIKKVELKNLIEQKKDVLRIYLEGPITNRVGRPCQVYPTCSRSFL